MLRVKVKKTTAGHRVRVLKGLGGRDVQDMDIIVGERRLPQGIGEL